MADPDPPADPRSLVNGVVEHTRLLVRNFRAIGGISELCDLAWKLCNENEALEADRARLQQELDQWRGWVQFLFLGGGHPQGTNGELQARVCEVWDRETQALKDELTTLRQALRQLAQQWETDANALVNGARRSHEQIIWPVKADKLRQCANELLARLRERST